MNQQKLILQKMSVGFSLIECMVYVALLIVVSTLVMNSITLLQARVTKQGARATHLTELYSALDVLVRDIRALQGDSHKLTESPYIWRTHEHEVSWSLEGDHLVRVQGSHKNKTGSGIKRFALQPVYRTVHDAQKLGGIFIVLEHQHSGAHKRFVATCERGLT